MTEAERKAPNPTRMVPKDYLKLPYHRVIRPQPDGTFIVEYFEFPEFHAHGATEAEAMAKLETMAEAWLAEMLARNRNIPSPASPSELERWSQGF